MVTINYRCQNAVIKGEPEMLFILRIYVCLFVVRHLTVTYPLTLITSSYYITTTAQSVQNLKCGLEIFLIQCKGKSDVGPLSSIVNVDISFNTKLI